MSLSPESLVNKSLDLVSSPSTYIQLNEMLKETSSSSDDISAVINTDPALVARLLKVVNSAFYGFPSQINTISRAITIIGTKELINLVLVTSVINSFKGIPDTLIKMNVFWQHSLGCAIAAQLIAKQFGYKSTERYFIAGLLQNIGSLVLYQSVPEIAKEILNSAQYGHELIYKAEQRLLGFDHTDVGQALIKEWRLPNSLAEVTKYHHAPSEATEFPVEVAIVHIADIIVSAAQLGHAGDSHIPPLDAEAWGLLDLNTQDIPNLLQQVDGQLNDLASALVA